MASLKTSQETSGYPLQKNDLHRIARSGNNHKVNSEELFSEVLTYAQFETKRTAGNLIAGRWYKVSECGYDLNQTILVLADTNITHNPRIKWLTAPNDAVECDAPYLSQVFNRYYDSNGNEFEQYDIISGTKPVIGALSTWFGTRLDGADNNSIYFPESSNVRNSYLKDLNLNMKNMSVETSRLVTVNNTVGSNDVPLNLYQCDFSNVVIYNNLVGGTTNFFNCDFKNVQLFISGSGNVNLSNIKASDSNIYITDEANISISSFNNVQIEILNNPTVENLNVIGKGNNNTQYKIDGLFQSQVLNNWAGTVVADTAMSFENVVANRVGFSTVKMNLLITDDFSANQGSYDYVSNSVFLLPNSIVGVYLFNALPAAANYDVNTIDSSVSQMQHKIEFAMAENPNNSTITFQFQTISGNVGTANEMVSYHGKTAKVGQLSNTAGNVILKAQWNSLAGTECWFLVYGNHYD